MENSFVKTIAEKIKDALEEPRLDRLNKLKSDHDEKISLETINIVEFVL